MDHFSLQCVDYKHEAAYYATLIGWKVRSDDGTKAVLDIGDDVGSVVIRRASCARAVRVDRMEGDLA
jgi:hypothetical protein